MYQYLIFGRNKFAANKEATISRVPSG